MEYVTPRGGAQQLEALYIKGKMVRYLHISPRINVGKSIQRHVRPSPLHHHSSSSLPPLYPLVIQPPLLLSPPFCSPFIQPPLLRPPSPLPSRHLTTMMSPPPSRPPPPPQLDSLDVQARRFQRARLRPQARVPGQHAPLLPPGGGAGGVAAPRVIQVTLPRPPARGGAAGGGVSGWS